MTTDELIDLLRNKTCGEISCDDCNADRIAAADKIQELQAEIADQTRLITSLLDKAHTYLNEIRLLRSALPEITIDPPRDSA